MKILSIALKDLRHIFRDKSNMFMMFGFPLLLIYVLGTALGGNAMSGKYIMRDKSAVYYVEHEGAVSQGFEKAVPNLVNEGIGLEKIDDINEGQELVKNGKKAALVIIDSRDKEIEVIKGAKYVLEGQIIEYAVESIAERIIGIEAEENIGDHTSIVSVNKKYLSSAMDYYGVTMLTLIIAYLITEVSSIIIMERRGGRENRMKVSGVTGGEIFAGTFIGFMIMGIAQVIVVMGVGHYLFNVYYGENIIKVGIMVVSQVALMVSIGIAVGVLSKPEGDRGNIVNIIIPVMIFLGGGYFPLRQLGDFFTKISVISPIAWINESVFTIIYAGGNEKFLQCIGINLGVSILMMIIVSLRFKIKGRSVACE